MLAETTKVTEYAPYQPGTSMLMCVGLTHAGVCYPETFARPLCLLLILSGRVSLLLWPVAHNAALLRYPLM